MSWSSWFQSVNVSIDEMLFLDFAIPELCHNKTPLKGVLKRIIILLKIIFINLKWNMEQKNKRLHLGTEPLTGVMLYHLPNSTFSN